MSYDADRPFAGAEDRLLEGALEMLEKHKNLKKIAVPMWTTMPDGSEGFSAWTITREWAEMSEEERKWAMHDAYYGSGKSKTIVPHNALAETENKGETK